MPTINRNFIRVTPSKREVANKERQKLYASKKWRNLRAIYLMEHPLCEECLKNGVVNGDEITVHHIQSPFEGGLDDLERWRRLLDYSNLRTLCRTCHGIEHSKAKQMSAIVE